MRSLGAIVLLSLLTASGARPALADEDLREHLLGPARPPAEYVAPHDRAVKLRRSGTALTIMAILHLGAAAAIGATYDISTSGCRKSSGCGDGFYGVAMMTPTVLLASTSALFASIGIPMWSVGAHNEKRDLRVGIGPTASGLRLTF